MHREGARPDNVTFNTIISTFAARGLLSEVIQIFQQMLLLDMEPDVKAFCCVLEVCFELASPWQVGKLIHEQVVERGLEVDISVGVALLNMYLKCEGMEDAQCVFDRLEPRGVEIWNALLSVYLQIGADSDSCSRIEQVQSGGLEVTQEQWTTSFQEFPTNRHIGKALELYCRMNQADINPDGTTFVHILRACLRMRASDHGKHVHTHIVEVGLEQDPMLGNILIHLYAGFGSFEDAYQVFRKVHKPNVVTFNTIFAACAQYSNLKLVLDHFCTMQQVGVIADGATFLSLFSACSRAGKEEIALFYFQKMREVYGIEPTYAHYMCMADLIGRRGYLKEGEDLLQTMPSRPNVVGLTSLLSHCRIHGSSNIFIGGH